MLDLLWSGLLGGLLIGAVALAAGGLPLVLLVLRELRALRTDTDVRLVAQAEAIEATDDRITSEVKRRASQAGVEARQGRQTEQQEVMALVERARASPGRQAGPGLLRGANRG